MTNTFESNGFTLKPVMNASKDGRGIFDNLLSVCYNNTEILYLRKNENETFNTIEFLKYPSAFRKTMDNVSLETVIKILKSVVTINFK